MSYTPTAWQTGDVVTAEKLNKLENGVTSAQVYTESETVRFSGSVTTEAKEGFNVATINCDLSDLPEQITVVFDGTEYTVSKTGFGNGYFAYGDFGETGPDFSEYPFVAAALQESTTTSLYIENEGTHQMVIKVATKTVNQELADVISNVVPIMRLIHNKTLSADAVEAFNDGKLLYFVGGGMTHIVTGTENNNFTYIPDGSNGCSFAGEYISITNK